MNDRSPPMEHITSFKVPPHSINAEQAMLGAVFIDNAVMAEMNGKLSPEMFYRKEHRIMYEAMLMLSQGNAPIDAITLSNILKASNELQEAGGIEYLGEIISAFGSAANAAHYADIVRDKWMERQLIGVGHGIADSGFNPEGRTVLERLTKAQTALMAIAGSDQKKEPTHINTAINNALHQIENRHQAKAPAGISTGFKDLDKLIGGLRKGEMIMIAGLPSSGKSTLSQNIIENCVLAGKNVLFFSVEMPEEMVMQRHLSSVGKIPLDQLLNSGVAEDDMFDSLSIAAGKLKDRFYHIDDDPGLLSTQILSRAQRIIIKSGRPLDLIVVDYMQKCNDIGKSSNERLEAISGNIKRAARTLGCPVIALSQLSREVQKRANKRPIMSDLRDSGALEQDADIIIFTHNEAGDDAHSEWRGIGELIVGKNRNGPKGSVYMTTRFEYARFENFFGKLPFSKNVGHSNAAGLEY